MSVDTPAVEGQRCAFSCFAHLLLLFFFLGAGGQFSHEIVTFPGPRIFYLSSFTLIITGDIVNLSFPSHLPTSAGEYRCLYLQYLCLPLCGAPQHHLGKPFVIFLTFLPRLVRR